MPQGKTAHRNFRGRESLTENKAERKERVTVRMIDRHTGKTHEIQYMYCTYSGKKSDQQRKQERQEAV